MSVPLLNNSVPSAADLIASFDADAATFKSIWAALGFGLPSESGTAVSKALTARNVSLSNTFLKARAPQTRDAFSQRLRPDVLFGTGLRQIFTDINSLIQQNIPTGLTFNGSGRTFLDMYLQCINANGTTVIAAPASTLTLTAATGGGIQPTTAGAEPRVKIVHIRSGEDWNWSQPSAASNQVALSGRNNAYTVTPTGTVPTGTGKIAVLRQFDNNAGASDPYYLDQFVTVTAGAAYPAITITKPDVQLNQGWMPPVWCQCLLNPEAAGLMAFALAAPSDINPFALAAVTSRSLPSPSNVSLGPTNQWCGPGGNSSHLEMGRWVSTAYTQGAFQTSNDVTQALQGFAGAFGGVQARTVATLNGTASLSSITYSYYDSAHPTTPQSATVTGPLSLATAVGSTVDLAIPAGRLVIGITGVTVGTATTGTIIMEAKSLRI